MDLTVAIDGPAAAGKGTLAKRLAAHLNLPHLDTGLLYRAVARHVLAGQDPEVAARALCPEDLQPEGLYTSQVAQQASKVAALGPVRAALIDFQRSFAGQAGGAGLDGRDIGTVVCPAAQVKLYVTARPEVRAERRHRELISKGAEVTLTQVMCDVNERDARDQDRAVAPLRAAPDAIEIDTSDLSIDAALKRAIVAVAQNRQRLKPS